MQSSTAFRRLVHLSRAHRTSLHRLTPTIRSSSTGYQSSSRYFPRHLSAQCSRCVDNFPALLAAHFNLSSLGLARTLCTQSDVAVPSAVQKTSSRELLLSPPALVITREYEWANIIIGFEQANKYTIRAAPGGEVVGFLAEETSFTGTITRNVMRTRRPFKATVFDKEGNIIFTMRRPLYLVSTSIYVESAEGEILGEVHMNWHLWRRRYDLYVEKSQFASVDSGFLAVDFDMRDIDGKKMASVNKDFTGFAREIFTDARQYVLRLDPAYGLTSDGMLVSDASTVDLAAEDLSEMKVGPRERAVILAAAVAIDFDYFSIHSRGHMHPGLMMMPGGGGPASTPAPGPGGMPPGAGAGAGAAVGADVLSNEADGGEDAADDIYGGAAASEANNGDAYDGTPNNASSADAADPYGTPLGNDEPTGSDTEWATFEEPDYGFTEEPPEDGADDDPWGSGGGDSDGESGGGLFGVLSDIFGGSDS